MVETVTADARPKNLASRVVGVITAPRATYSDVVARPRALGVLLVIIAISASTLGVFMSTEVGREALLDQQIRTMESFGMHPNDAQYERMKEADARPPVIAMVAQAVFLVVVATVIAAVALAVFNLMGGDGSFKQTFAVVAHSGVIIALQQLFVTPLNYARQSLSSPTNLGVFFPFLDENTFVARLLGGIDLFLIWWIVTLAIGFGVLYRRRTAPVATAMIGVYVLLALIVAAVKSALSGA